MSDFDETDYHMSEDSRSEEDEDDRFEELYVYAKAEPSSEAQLRRFDDLFSLELAMQKKTIWGFKASKRLLKSAIEQSDLEATTARYGQLLSYENAVTTNDFERCASKIVNRLANPSQTEVLRALLFITVANVSLTSVSARTAIKLAQALVRLQPTESSLGSLTDLQHRLESTSDIAKMTKNRCLLELYATEIELFWRVQRFEHMDVMYCKALSIEDTTLRSQQMGSAHGFYGRFLLQCDKPLDALVCLAKAVSGYELTSNADEHHTACVQSLALVAYIYADNIADKLLEGYSGRPDVAAIRRFAMAFLREDVDGLDQVLDEVDGTFKDSEIRRLLLHYETVLKRKLCLKTSPLPADCWSDVLQCLTHPAWLELRTLCRKFERILAPILHHVHSGDVQKASFDWRVGVTARWEITLQSKSGRPTQVVPYDCMPNDAVLASATVPSDVIVEINKVNAVTNEGIVRFCFGGDGRRLDINQPMITHRLFGRLVEEHLAATNALEFNLTVTCPCGSDIRRQTRSAYSQHFSYKDYFHEHYEIPSSTAMLIVKLAFDARDVDTMTVTRKRLTTPESRDDEESYVLN